MSTIYPLSFLVSPINTQPITFNQDYIEHLEALNVLDYFLPSQFASNPLFAQVDSLNQNIGLLQTANNAIETVLEYIDAYKNLNNPTEDALKELSQEINDVLKNTTFNDMSVFNQTITIGDNQIKLEIPEFTPDTNLDEYEKLLLEKQKDIFNVLNNIDTLTPFNSNEVNPIDFETFTSLLNSGTLLQAYNTGLINPLNIQMLLS
jgi:hypothetical protein